MNTKKILLSTLLIFSFVTFFFLGSPVEFFLINKSDAEAATTQKKTLSKQAPGKKTVAQNKKNPAKQGTKVQKNVRSEKKKVNTNKKQQALKKQGLAKKQGLVQKQQPAKKPNVAKKIQPAKKQPLVKKTQAIKKQSVAQKQQPAKRRQQDSNLMRRAVGNKKLEQSKEATALLGAQGAEQQVNIIESSDESLVTVESTPKGKRLRITMGSPVQKTSAEEQEKESSDVLPSTGRSTLGIASFSMQRAVAAEPPSLDASTATSALSDSQAFNATLNAPASKVSTIGEKTSVSDASSLAGNSSAPEPFAASKTPSALVTPPVTKNASQAELRQNDADPFAGQAPIVNIPLTNPLFTSPFSAMGSGSKAGDLEDSPVDNMVVDSLDGFSSMDSPEVDPYSLYSEQVARTDISLFNLEAMKTAVESVQKSLEEVKAFISLSPLVELSTSWVKLFDGKVLINGLYCNIFEGTVQKGHTAGLILQDWLNPVELQRFVKNSNAIFPLKKIREGQSFKIIHADGRLAAFEYEIDDSEKLVVSRDEKDFNVSIKKIEYDTLLEKVEGEIKGSLFETMAIVGESPALAVNLATIFAWEINFIRDIQPGDSFRLIVEKRFKNGEFKGYGRILAANFTNKGKAYEAFSYSPSGKPGYYSANGESVKRAFLKAPLSFTRITSRFTPKRLHPILKTWRAHPAVDYAAPIGTPVKAIGKGTVIFAGWGKGAGNYITLKHPGGYESMYLHLSGFAKGLKKGKAVDQGELIGYVGSTGYSTGPHLDFRIKKNGTFVNPETLLSPRAEPLQGKTLQEFFQKTAELRKYLYGEKSLTEYTKERGLF